MAIWKVSLSVQLFQGPVTPAVISSVCMFRIEKLSRKMRLVSLCVFPSYTFPLCALYLPFMYILLYVCHLWNSEIWMFDSSTGIFRCLYVSPFHVATLLCVLLCFSMFLYVCCILCCPTMFLWPFTFYLFRLKCSHSNVHYVLLSAWFPLCFLSCFFVCQFSFALMCWVDSLCQRLWFSAFRRCCSLPVAREMF